MIRTITYSKYILAGLLSCALVFSLMASDNTGSGTQLRTLDFEPRISGEVFISTMQADGSPYLHDNWVRGDLFLRDGSLVREQYFRYNGYLDALIWRQPRSLQSVKVAKDMVEQFVLHPPGGDSLIFQNITLRPWYESASVNLYAQILYKGDISLVVHQRIRRTGETLESRGTRIISRPRIEHDPVFYVLMPDHEARELRRHSRRSLSRLFPDHRAEVRASLRNEGIRINSQEDLVRAIKIIDKMLSE